VGSGTLITGASGFIGRRLLQAGDRLLMRHCNQSPDSVVGDLLDIESLRVACEGIDCIFHCAGYAHAFGSSDADMHWRINCEGTRNLLKAAGEAGVQRFVFLSSVKAMAEPGDECVDEDWPGEPATAYGRAKRAAESEVLEAALKYGMHAVNLRLAMVYGRSGKGNLERMARGIRAGWFPPLPETGNRRSLVHVDDVVAAIRRVADATAAGARTYIVADASAYSGREIYDAICAVMSAPTPEWRLPAWLLRASGSLGDVAEVVLRRALPLNSEAVSRLLDSACYLPGRIERDLDWRSKVGLVQGIREMLV
jgi:UDP-glucose 4-epimerase